jgi:hypothetical protein
MPVNLLHQVESLGFQQDGSYSINLADVCGCFALAMAGCRWDAIVPSGVIKPEDVYVVADAESCKPLERWALGNGLDVASVINTGGTGRWGGL